MYYYFFFSFLFFFFFFLFHKYLYLVQLCFALLFNAKSQNLGDLGATLNNPFNSVA